MLSTEKLEKILSRRTSLIRNKEEEYNIQLSGLADNLEIEKIQTEASTWQEVKNGTSKKAIRAAEDFLKFTTQKEFLHAAFTSFVNEVNNGLHDNKE